MISGAVALGAVQLCESVNPLEVYRWWFGDAASSDALPIPEGVSPDDALFMGYLPTENSSGAHLFVLDVDHVGLLAVVATYGLTRVEAVRVIQHLSVDAD